MGLLRYGIPDFKMEKWVLDRRVDLLEAEGITFETGYDIGVDVTAEQLRERFDAVVLAVGADRPRDVDVPGRELQGVHFAMDYLVQQNRRVAGERVDAQPEITAQGRKVVIIGGGDTGADCLGNVIREQCTDVQQLYIYAQPPDTRPDDNSVAAVAVDPADLPRPRRGRLTRVRPDGHRLRGRAWRRARRPRHSRRGAPREREPQLRRLAR